MTEFKVGDKVTLNTRAGTKATIEYGPYNTSPTYLVKLIEGEDAGVVFPAMAYVMKAAPAFAVGDMVNHRLLGTVEITYGPYTDTLGQVRYMIRLAGGSEQPMRAEMLTALPKPALVPVGTRVRIDRAAYAEESHGWLATVTNNTGTWRVENDDTHVYRVRLDDGDHIWAAEVTPVDDTSTDIFGMNTFEHNGTVYDLSAKYADRDGDVWSLARVGAVVRARMTRDGDGPPTSDSNTLATVVSSWGPLRKI
ncbi:phiSA1p31-related protein [Streptomyces sp. NPDC056638]|uniref:phiSA1p31-related protein n=1 Tax=Streptomyces sp. NPDC056638 TaxID=3345887 RepID=UPI0036BF6A35